MREHRLIERMSKLIIRNSARFEETHEPDMAFIDAAIDFLKWYTDRCRHGKEEGILFRDLTKKQLSPEHKKIMDELIREHVLGRRTVGYLFTSKERHIDGDADALKDIVKNMRELAELYPRHIEKDNFKNSMRKIRSIFLIQYHCQQLVRLVARGNCYSCEE